MASVMKVPRPGVGGFCLLGVPSWISSCLLLGGHWIHCAATFAGLLFAGSVQNAACGEKQDISLDRVQRGENWQGKWLPGQTCVRFAVRL